MPAHRSSAVPLAWLYAALIVWASLFPFSGWRVPGASLAAFVQQPWNRGWTPFDVWSNVLGYLPLGLLVFAAWVRSGGRARRGFVLAGALGAAMSLAMELLQTLLPARVPSLLDLATNAGGALAGASLGLLIHAAGGIGRWQSVRERWFVPHARGGIALLLLWPVALLFPTPVPLGVGQVLGEVQGWIATALADTSAQAWVDDWLQPEPSWVALSRASEVGAVALGLLAPACVVAAVSPRGLRRVLLLASTAAVAVGATTLSTAMNFGPSHALAWLTPTALAGLVIGTVLALLLAWAPHRLAAALGLAATSALVAVVTQAPADPYFAQSLQGWEQGRFIRFHGAAQWVGWFWPYAVLAYLVARLASREPA
jgi:VanZ family protein